MGRQSIRTFSIRNAYGKGLLIEIDGTPRQISRFARAVQSLGYTIALTTRGCKDPTVRPSEALRILRGK